MTATAGVFLAATSVEVSQTPFERDERDWDWWEAAAAAAVVAAGTTWVWVASFSAGVATPRPSRASEGELLCAMRVKMCSKITNMQFVRGTFLPEAVGFAAFAVPATAVVAVGSVALVAAAAASAGSAGRPASPASSSASFARSARAQMMARMAKGDVSATGLGSVSARSEEAGQAAESKYMRHVYYPVAPH